MASQWHKGGLAFTRNDFLCSQAVQMYTSCVAARPLFHLQNNLFITCILLNTTHNSVTHVVGQFLSARFCINRRRLGGRPLRRWNCGWKRHQRYGTVKIMQLHRARLNAARRTANEKRGSGQARIQALLDTCQGSKNLNHRDKYVNPGPPEFAAES